MTTAAGVPAGPFARVVGVVEGPDGRPIAGATVTGWPLREGVPVGLGARAVSAASGRFDLQAVPGVPLEVVATHDALLPSAPARCSKGQPTCDVTLRLRAGGTITGRVVDAVSREPLPEAFVRVERVEGADDPGRPRRESARDANGAFTLGPLPDGTYRLRVRAPDRLPAEIPTVVVSSRHRTDLGDVALAAGAFVEATVLDEATRAPLAGVVVRPLAADRATPLDGAPRAATDRFGRFRLGPVAPGPTSVRLSLPGYGARAVELAAAGNGEPGRGESVALARRPGARAQRSAHAEAGPFGPGLGVRGGSGRVVVTTVVPASSAATAGLVPGAVVTAVDGQPAGDVAPEALFALLQGARGSTVTVTAQLPGEVAARTFALLRD